MYRTVTCDVFDLDVTLTVTACTSINVLHISPLNYFTTITYLKGIYKVDSSRMLPLIGLKTFETRGHCLKIQKRCCRTKLRANFFGFRIVNIWNGLPDDVVLSPTLNSFKGRIDRHWGSLRYSVFWWCHCLLMIWFNGSDLISPKANNGLLQPRLQHDDDDVVFVLFCPMFQFITFEIVQGRSRSRIRAIRQQYLAFLFALVSVSYYS